MSFVTKEIRRLLSIDQAISRVYVCTEMRLIHNSSNCKNFADNFVGAQFQNRIFHTSSALTLTSYKYTPPVILLSVCQTAWGLVLENYFPRAEGLACQLEDTYFCVITENNCLCGYALKYSRQLHLLREGNDFGRVCQSFCSRGGGGGSSIGPWPCLPPPRIPKYKLSASGKLSFDWNAFFSVIIFLNII